MSTHKVVASKHETDHGTLRSYVVGFALSVYLTLTAYLVVVHRLLSRDMLIAGVAGLAFIQFLVQLLFFLHLGRETKPRWKLAVFCFMVLIVSILVGGSLWIMENLNYHMTPAQITQYLNSQDNL